MILCYLGRRLVAWHPQACLLGGGRDYFMEDRFRLVILSDYLEESAGHCPGALVRHAKRDFVPEMQRGDEGNLGDWGRPNGRRSTGAGTVIVQSLRPLVIASAAKQSRIFPRRDSGLLRCARSDVDGVRPSSTRTTRGESPSPGSHLRCDPASPRRRGEAKTLNQLPLRQILHQRADAEGPGLALVAGAHAVDELAELGR